MPKDERRQLMIARKLWARPYPSTVERVKEDIAKERLRWRHRAPNHLSRDQIEVLDILVEMTERGFSS